MHSFLACRGFRERLLADPSFLVKVGIEVGIGIFTKSSAEYAKRGENFSKVLTSREKSLSQSALVLHCGLSSYCAHRSLTLC